MFRRISRCASLCEAKILMFNTICLCLLLANAALCESVEAEASGTEITAESCNVFAVIEANAAITLAKMSVESRDALKKLQFDKSDPVYEFRSEASVLTSAVAEIRRKIEQCEGIKEDQLVDSIYKSIFVSPEWGKRTLLVALAQKVRSERLHLVEPYTAFLIEVSNEGTVPTAPPESCDAKTGYSTAMFSEDKQNVWFRNRALSWVVCTSGRIMTYLPETGWAEATETQIEAIRKFSPTCCEAAKQ